MTVSTEVNQAAYTGNGVTAVFPYTFRILNASNLTVTRIDLLEVETVLTLGTDYTVSGAGTYNGGAVTLPQPLPAGYSLVIERDLAAVQETDLRNQGKFFAEVHEDVFDYLTMLVQQVTSWLGLALRRPTIKSKFYDAKQYRIANLADPINSQDAVNNQTLLKSLADLSTDGSGQFVLQMLASTAPGLGASLVSDENGLNVQEMLSLGRIVYPEMFGVGISEPTDDELWERMFTYLESLPDTSLSNDLPYLIDMRGKEYTILQTHQIDINLGVINGFVHFNGGRFIFGDYTTPAEGGKTRRYLIDFRWDYIGNSYFPFALVEIVRAYNTHIKNPTCWAGVSTDLETTGGYVGKPKRARHALWFGSRRAWGCSVIGGDIYGGEIPLRLGYTNDHTGIFIGGGLTIHHGWVGNLLGCNLAGSTILGCNIEHSENGAWDIALTSGTNGVSNALRGVLIAGVYAYNNGNGTSGSDYAPAAILVGYDVPGTEGFDVAGQLITSDGQARNVTVMNCDIVSSKQLRAVKMRGLSGLKCIDNSYGIAPTEIYGFSFDGSAARSDCIDNRNQASGVFDEVEYTSTSKPRVGTRLGTFLPVLVGGTIAGSLVYSTRGGDYSVSNGMCSLSLWITVGSITTQPTGNLTITLPIAITSGRRSGCGVFALALVDGNSALPITANITNGTTLSLFLSGAPMQGEVIQVTTDIRLSILYPIDGATYTGA